MSSWILTWDIEGHGSIKAHVQGDKFPASRLILRDKTTIINT